MNKKVICLLLGGMTASFSGASAAQETQGYSEAMAAISEMCPSCSKVSGDIMSALNSTCSTPMTLDNLQGVIENTQMYMWLLALDHSKDGELYRGALNSATETLKCDEMDSWQERASQHFGKTG